jgi:hypothetical protein
MLGAREISIRLHIMNMCDDGEIDGMNEVVVLH